MDKSKILTGLGILTGVVALGLIIGWLATRGTEAKAPTTSPGNATTVEKTTPPPTTTHLPHTTPRVAALRNPTPVTGSNTDGVPIATEMTSTNWEDKLDEILSSDEEDTNKVKLLFAMFPTLPADGQEDVAQHLSNLVEDEDYAPLGKLLMDARLPEPVLDVLLADLLNRPNETKLPMFLDLAKNPDHSKAGEAKELLELYLDEDYGNDWTKWESAMKKWLAENPD